jgi:isoaspartyl peptidase/L-asparaginase-like protein (Ntn-hydrolase superfamily)
MISLMGREEAGAVKAVKLTKSPIRLAESIM